jgi:hypothetical protein
MLFEFFWRGSKYYLVHFSSLFNWTIKFFRLIILELPVSSICHLTGRPILRCANGETVFPHDWVCQIGN